MTTVKDPVCGMTVDDAEAKAISEYESKTFFFCSARCKETFDSAPTTFM